MSGTLPKLSPTRREALRSFTEIELRAEVQERRLERCDNLAKYQAMLTKRKQERRRAKSRKNMLGVGGFDALDTMGDATPRTIRQIADYIGRPYTNASRITLTLWRHGLLSRVEGTPIPVGRPGKVYRITQKGKLRLTKELARGREPGVPNSGKRRTP